MTSGFLRSFGSRDIAETIGVGFLERHLSGDFGDLGSEDIQSNINDIKRKGMVLSKYRVRTPKGQTISVYVITDPGHHQTTILLPSER